jgi:hypothetical protein
MQDFAYEVYHEGHGSNFREVGRFENQSDEVFSGTMIAPQWVVTTAHTVDAAKGLRFHQKDKSAEASAWYTPGDWQRDPFFDGNDIALVRLDEPINNADTTSLRRKGSDFDKDTWVAGWGAVGTSDTGPMRFDNQLHAGQNRIEGRLFGNNNMGAMEFDTEPSNSNYTGPAFDIDDAEDGFPLPLEYLPANQDAGGGVFFNGQLLGVQSSVFGLFDGNTDYSYMDTVGITRVQPWTNWIDAVISAVEGGRIPDDTLVGLPGNPIFTRGEALNLTVAQIQQGRFLIGDLLPPNVESGFFLGPLGSAVIPEPTTALLLAPLAVWGIGRRPRQRGPRQAPSVEAN